MVAGGAACGTGPGFLAPPAAISRSYPVLPPRRAAPPSGRASPRRLLQPPEPMLSLAILLWSSSAPCPAAGEPAEVSLLTDVVVAPEGDVYVADAGRRRILCVSERWGEPRTVVAFGADGPVRWPERLALGEDGALFVADPRTHRVLRVDTQDGSFEVVAGTGVPGLDREGRATEVPLSHPAGIVVRGEQLLIADLGNRAVRAVDLARGTISTLAGGWQATRTTKQDGFFVAPGRFLPSDLALAPDGTLLVLDLEGRCVLTVDEETGEMAELEGSSNLVDTGSPAADQRIAARRSFAVDGSGGSGGTGGSDGSWALLFAEGPAGRVTRLAPGGAEPTTLCEDGLAWPSAVAVGGDGAVHVVDAGRAVLARIAPGSARATVLYRSDSPPSDGSERELQVLRKDPDPEVVTDPDVARAIRDSGHPWSVVHVPTGIELRLVPPGSFARGARLQADDPRGDARPVHEVVITRPLYVSRTEVTNRQYRTLDPSHVSLLSSHHDLVRGLDGLSFDADEQPATSLCWHDADDFARRWGFRLPTEAEWEHFARAGSDGRYAWGDELEEGAAWANFPGAATAELVSSEIRPVPWEDGYPLTAPVASFRANAFGLHDAIGNVWEFCADWYGTDEYRRCADGTTDPTGPAEGRARVLRGSSWLRPFEGSALVSFRASARLTAHHVLSRGVRVVLDP